MTDRLTRRYIAGLAKHDLLSAALKLAPTPEQQQELVDRSIVHSQGMDSQEMILWLLDELNSLMETGNIIKELEEQE